MNSPTIFSRFLTALEVPHTDAYSDSRFREMTFNSLFGLSHLLTEYGIANEALLVGDKTELTLMPTPFLAQTTQGVFVIVNRIDTGAGLVTYDSLGESETVCLKGFEKAWNGIALIGYPDDKSVEPEFRAHRLATVVGRLSGYALALAVTAVTTYFFVTRGLYAHLSTVLLFIFNLLGLYFSFLLVQKSLHIHTAASDRVCGVLEQGGCDSIMELKVSKLFGVFSWSEVGLGYFGVSLITLLLFPHLWPALALCNVCCLPYTVWSIWYQRFRAHHWCTLCVGVQSTLWAIFLTNLSGGWLAPSFPVRFDFIILIAVYVFAVLSINLLLRMLKSIPCHEEDN